MGKILKHIIGYKWVYIFIAIPLIPVVINYLLLTWHFPGVQGKYNDWLGFFSNYSGGIIGGIVALLIAKSQFSFQEKQENDRRFLDQLPTLTKILLELEKIKAQFEAAKDIRNNLPKEMPEEVKRNLYKSNLELEPLIKDRWTDLDKLVDSHLQSELYKLLESYERTVEVLGFNLAKLQLNNKKIELEINKIKKKIDQGEATELEKIDCEILTYQLQNDMLKYKVIEDDKKHYWNLLDRAYNKSDELYNLVKSQISNINKSKKSTT